MQRRIVEEIARGVIRSFEPRSRSSTRFNNDDFADRREVVTTKRMERRTPSGTLISITDIKTRHFDDISPFPERIDGSHPQHAEYYPPREYSTATTSYASPDTLTFTERRYSPRKKVEIHYPITVERQIRRSRSDDYIDPLTIVDSTSSPSDDWRRTDSVIKQSTIVKNPHLYERGDAGSPYVTSMDALVARINYLRRSIGRRELLHSPKLARIAGEWAERIAITGQMRLDDQYPMNAWMGPVVTPSIADSWWQESEIYRSTNYFKQDDLLHIAAAKAFCERRNIYVVVAVYD